MNKKLLRKLILISLIACLALPALHSQTWPMPGLPDTTGFGRMIQRTMTLLATSTPDHRNTVKVLVYGQSISEQDWWLEIRRYLQAKFPYANLIMENRSIGGFSSQFLKKTVRMDVDDNSDGSDRQAYLVVRGYGGVADSVLIRQTGASPEGLRRVESTSPVVYPNPATDDITIKSDRLITGVIIRDASGRMVSVLESKGSPVVVIPAGRLAGGLYFLEIDERQSLHRQENHGDRQRSIGFFRRCRSWF